jgi:rhodanese-related sulfurtransferase
MKKFEIFMVVLLLIGAIWAFTLDDVKRHVNEEFTPCQLIDLTAKADKFITTDELAKRLMNNDPSIVLIDLRKESQFAEYSLPGATNIPIEHLLDDQYKELLDQKTYTNIFFGNSSDLAAKAWMICTRMGYDNIYILKGGLNYWAETILRPVAPKQTAKNAEFVKYNFRKAASAYFVGTSVVDENKESTNTAPVKVTKRKKQEAAGGGCD